MVKYYNPFFSPAPSKKGFLSALATSNSRFYDFLYPLKRPGSPTLIIIYRNKMDIIILCVLGWGESVPLNLNPLPVLTFSKLNNHRFKECGIKVNFSLKLTSVNYVLFPLREVCIMKYFLESYFFFGLQLLIRAMYVSEEIT